MEHQLVNVDAGRQARRQVASSTAYDLVRSSAPEEEIRRALSPELRAALPLAIRSLAQDLAPGGPDDHAEMVIALGRQIGLLKAGLAVEHKEDWISIALSEVSERPPAIVLEALREVRRKARFEGDVVPAVLDLVEPQIAKLQTECKHVEHLVALAG